MFIIAKTQVTTSSVKKVIISDKPMEIILPFYTYVTCRAVELKVKAPHSF